MTPPVAWDPRDRVGLVPRRRGRRRPRLFVVAVEGESEEPDYFSTLEGLGVVAPHHLVVLPPTQDPTAASHERGSDPASSLDRLVDYVAGQIPAKLDDADEFWLVVDVDRHHTLGPTLGRLRRRGRQWAAAVSNPCFEVWLQLHLVDVAGFEGRAKAASQRAKRRWRSLKAAHDPVRLSRRMVELAIERSRATDEGGDVPAACRSHVHRLVERLLAD